MMLSLNVPILGVFFLSIFTIYKYIIYPAFISPLSRVPNAHWSSPVSPLWILWTRYKVRENRVIHAAHLKYGSVIRLGPNELSVNDISGVRTVYSGGFEKGQWYSIFDNYGYVTTTLWCPGADSEKRSMYVFLVAFPSSLGQETNDLKYLLKVISP